MGTRKNFVVPGGITVDSSTLYVDDPNNRVGIGKTNPDHTLDVSGVIKASNGVITLTTAGTPSSSLADGAIAVDTSNSKLYFRSGSSWVDATAAGGGASIEISATAPTSPTEGDLWYNSSTAAIYIYYDSEWVETGTPDIDSLTTTVATKGDIVVATGSNTVDNLPVGTDDYVLAADSAASLGVSWKDPNTLITVDDTTKIPKSIVNAKGDLLVGSSDDTPAVLSIGANNSLLIADSSATYGVKWSADLSNTIIKGVQEAWQIAGSAATGTVNIDVLSGSVHYYTSNSSANWTINIRGNSSTSLNSVLSVGNSVTVAFAAANGTTAYYANAFTVDGTSVTPKWLADSPTSGTSNAVDIYNLTVIKTGASPTYEVFASYSAFK
jgi:hypothetical protein